MLWRACIAAASVTAGGVAAAVHVMQRDDGPVATASTTPAPRRFPVTIGASPGPPRVDTGRVDAAGRPVTASCSTCHATREPDFANRRATDLDEFHLGLTFAHGSLACLSCHDPADYDGLRLADGTPVAYAEVMTLCGQCHGKQVRDYEHGAHGGMTGYWDLTRGPRQRHGCVACHDPHAPAFPRMMPTFKPADRFLAPGDGHGSGHE